MTTLELGGRRGFWKTSLSFCVLVAVLAGLEGRGAYGMRIRDVVRLKNEVPNELVGMGLVVGLQGTGDGGDFQPAMRQLKELMGRLEAPVISEKELKNANNVAIVHLSVTVPSEGAHSGERLDVKVASAAVSKSLKGGTLVVGPMYAPIAGRKLMVLGSASGGLVLPDEKTPTQAVIPGGAVLIEDILPEEIKDNVLTMVVLPKWASRELSSAIADQINEDVAPQTGGKPIAIAVDSTSVQVTIPPTERGNPTPFIARMLTLTLPTLSDPATVIIDEKNGAILFSDEVEIAPVLVTVGNLTINIGQAANPPGTKVPFVALDPTHKGNAKLKDLQDALNLLKVSARDRITIVRNLNTMKALKAKLIEQ